MRQWARFNPRLRVGGDPIRTHTTSSCLVSIHASAWEATNALNSSLRRRRVSIHASAWEATWPQAQTTRQTCFNPRLRVGGDCHHQFADPLYRPVSIHASAWEATKSCMGISGKIRVSIHASAWEATYSPRSLTAGPPSFNPRLRVGGDGPGVLRRWLPSSFNPRLRVGGDHTCKEYDKYMRKFQSTPPRGRRRGGGMTAEGEIMFQSTPPRGRRHERRQIAEGQRDVSIHASAWEATPCPACGASVRLVSIHASAWEATPWKCRQPRPWPCFNPRLRVGGDRPTRCGSGHFRRFQSTPPRGRRLCRGQPGLTVSSFQSTPPRGRRPDQ